MRRIIASPKNGLVQRCMQRRLHWLKNTSPLDQLARSFRIDSSQSSLLGYRKAHFHQNDSKRSYGLDANVEDISRSVQKASERYAGRLAIRHSDRYCGYGLFALRDFEEGELLFRASKLKEYEQPSSHTIQIGWNQHVLMDLPGRLINHICNQANVGLKWCGDEGTEFIYDFIALANIPKDQELLCDYETFEYELSQSLDCCCGSSTCRGRLRGFRYHASLVRETFQPAFIAPYLLSPRPIRQQPGSS